MCYTKLYITMSTPYHCMVIVHDLSHDYYCKKSTNQCVHMQHSHLSILTPSRVLTLSWQIFVCFLWVPYSFTQVEFYLASVIWVQHHTSTLPCDQIFSKNVLVYKSFQDKDDNVTVVNGAVCSLLIVPMYRGTK